MPFRDRADAGRRLAWRLRPLRELDPVVLGLARGGVPVAFEVAKELEALLDVLVVRKLGVPSQPELGMGAIGEDGVRVINDEVMRTAQVSPAELAAVELHERGELERRARRLRAGRPRIPLTGRAVIVVDDGIATGSTARAACRVARAHGARAVVLAAPVAAADSIRSLRADADEVICLSAPAFFLAIGQWYENFSQTSDEQVVDLLTGAAAWPVTTAAPRPGTAPGQSPDQRRGGGAAEPRDRDEEVRVAAGSVVLAGHLTVPAQPAGIVVFVHGSGSSRRSPRNQHVASVLNDAGLGTLLFDLLTADEERNRANVFDIALLAARLADVTGWLRRQPEALAARIGYFGASTGAAAALWAAAEPAARVAAVVSRGGRPDLAGPRLPAVHVPTLLIVGGRDELVLDLNRAAQQQLGGQSRLDVIPGATHLFEEAGALAAVAGLARDWFTEHLAEPGTLGSAGVALPSRGRPPGVGAQRHRGGVSHEPGDDSAHAGSDRRGQRGDPGALG